MVFAHQYPGISAGDTIAQVSAGYYDSKSTNISATDSLGQAFILSSAGFMSFALSGTSRQADGVYDRFAIPVFSW